MATPKLSIIVPIYNVEPYLRKCVESLLTQDLDPAEYEIILVDDGSTDGCPAICDEYAQTLHPSGGSRKGANIKVIHQQNAGLSAARNTGIMAAKGQYIFFLDSDDKLSSPRALQHLAEVIDDGKNYDMICFSGRRFIDGTDQYTPAQPLLPMEYMSGMDYFAEGFMAQKIFPFVCVVLRIYRREWMMTNQLRFAEGIYHEDDRFTPIACYCARNVRVISDCIYDYRYREASITTTINPKRANDLLATANYLAAKFTKERKFPHRNAMYRYIGQHYQKALLSGADSGSVVWKLYFRISHNRLRHYLQFWANWLKR